MTEYRFVFLDASGGVARAITFPCLDDLEALDLAVNMHDGPHLQVWDGSRIVVRMDDHGDAESDAVITRGQDAA